MEITQDERDVLLDLAAEYDYPEYDPNKHVLVEDAMKLWGLTDRGSQGRLDKLVRDGGWGVEKVFYGGRKRNGYYKK
jgi:hypothetical protein